MAHMRLTIGLLGTLILATPSWAQTGPVPGPMHEWAWRGWWPLGGLIWLAFLGLAIVGLVTVIRWLFGDKGPGRVAPSSALSILEQRYARGEIDREEYQQRRQDLGG